MIGQLNVADLVLAIDDHVNAQVRGLMVFTAQESQTGHSVTLRREVEIIDAVCNDFSSKVDDTLHAVLLR